jgi:flagellin
MRIEKHLQDQLAHKLAQGAKEKGKVLEQLATGKRINRASDDAAGLAVAKEFDKQVRAYRNAAENIQAGLSALDRNWPCKRPTALMDKSNGTP